LIYQFFVTESLDNATVQRLYLSADTGSGNPSSLLSMVFGITGNFFFSEVTFTEPLSFATFFSQYLDLPFPLSTLRIRIYVLLASWCNERSVRTIGDQWRAGVNSGVPLWNKESLFSNGFFRCNRWRQKLGVIISFLHSVLFCSSNSMGLWSLNVKGKKQGMEKFLFFYFFAAKSC